MPAGLILKQGGLSMVNSRKRIGNKSVLAVLITMLLAAVALPGFSEGEAVLSTGGPAIMKFMNGV
jgi:hypothetical protein